MTSYNHNLAKKVVSAVSNAETVSPGGVPAGINRQYKDRLFKFLFGNPEHRDWTLALYNAVNGTSYDNPNDITFTTIQDAVYMGMKNDVSLLLADTMNFYEQQSSYNPNMPIRFLVYAGMVYSAYIEDPDNDINVFSERQQLFPVPKLVCFYNGMNDQPESKILHLANAFDRPELSDIALDVTVLNINSGKNQSLMAACQPLREYSELVENIRRAQRTLKNIGAAIDQAINAMPDDSLIKPSIIANRAEVKRMFITEYDEAATMEKFKREADRSRMEKDARGMYKKGLSLDDIAEVLEVNVDVVEQILGLKKA